MKEARFRVATCEGYPIPDNPTARRSGAARLTLSATVCDTWNLWREVKTYRSEDRVFRKGRMTTRGRDGAEKDAADHAQHLNRWHAAELHKIAVRESRARARHRG